MNTGSIRIADVRVLNGSIKVEVNAVGSSLEVVRNRGGAEHPGLEESWERAQAEGQCF